MDQKGRRIDRLPFGIPAQTVLRREDVVRIQHKVNIRRKRLATEHAVLEDTGKGDGERNPSTENGEGKLAAAFPVVRLGANAAAARDPAKRPLLDKKEEIEQAIDKLKYDKAAMPEAEYKRQLTQLLLELAKTQEALDK